MYFLMLSIICCASAVEVRRSEVVQFGNMVGSAGVQGAQHQAGEFYGVVDRQLWQRRRAGSAPSVLSCLPN